MRALLWGLIAVTVAAVIYDATATDHTVATCPNTTRMTQILASIRTGDLGPDDAEKMAKTYELAGCYEAALQIRSAALATKATGVIAKTITTPGAGTSAVDKALGGLQWGPSHGPAGGGDGGSTATPVPTDPDRFSIDAIPDPSVRTLAQTLMTKNPCAWTNDDFATYDLFQVKPASNGRILQAFIDHGVFYPGASRVDQVTALNDLSRQYLLAWKCRSSV